MDSAEFIDYYDVLDVSVDATTDAIEHNFRSLARKFHPDNQATGDRAKFDLILLAHGVLRDSAKRAQYHSDFHLQLAARGGLGGSEANPHSGPDRPERAAEDFGIERDVDVQNRLLTLLYVRRRTNIRDPGIGDAELERLSACPSEHLEFHLWYLKEKGWIRRTEDGLLSITIDGVDRATSIHQAEHAKKLITDQS